MANNKTNENNDIEAAELLIEAAELLMDAAIEHMQDQANVYGEANIIEDAAYHKKMAAGHLNWSAAHNSEVDNGGHEDHDYHAGSHDDAYDAYDAHDDFLEPPTHTHHRGGGTPTHGRWGGA